MKSICIITGGSSLGVEVAKIIGQEQHIILTGCTATTLEQAAKRLRALGVEAETYACNTSDRVQVEQLAEYAEGWGHVKTVIHAAGVSSRTLDATMLFLFNTLNTIHINEVFAPRMGEGSCILNVASMAAYTLPPDSVPLQLYNQALTDLAVFSDEVRKMIAQIPAANRNSMAYAISKNFVIWYSKHMAVRYGKQGVRVVSISPGVFNTSADENREEAVSFAKNGALGRLGKPEEIARMMAFLVSDQASYLTGVDVLCDGGAVSAMQVARETQH